MPRRDRLAQCEWKQELNRAFIPSIFLGVDHVWETDGQEQTEIALSKQRMNGGCQ